MNLTTRKYGREASGQSIKTLGSGPRATNVRITQNSSLGEIDEAVRKQVSRDINTLVKQRATSK